MTYRQPIHAKARAIAVFTELHALHVSRSMIAQLTGFSSPYVGEVLSDLGLHQRWDKTADWQTELERRYPALAEACETLAAIRLNHSIL